MMQKKSLLSKEVFEFIIISFKFSFFNSFKIVNRK